MDELINRVTGRAAFMANAGIVYDAVTGRELFTAPGGGAEITVDSELDGTSENPVQNKAVKAALDGKADSYHIHSVSHITGLSQDLEDKADAQVVTGIDSRLTALSGTVAGKIDNPSGGSAGQVLTKTSGGVQWATPATGGLDSAGVLNAVSSAGYITSSAVNNKLDMYVQQSTYGIQMNQLQLALDEKANLSVVYGRDDLYTKTEIDAKFGTFETQANAVIGGN